VIKQVVRESDVLLVLVFMLMLYKIRKHITASWQNTLFLRWFIPIKSCSALQLFKNHWRILS